MCLLLMDTDSEQTGSEQNTELLRPFLFTLIRQRDANQHHAPASQRQARFKDRQKESMTPRTSFSLSLAYYLPFSLGMCFAPLSKDQRDAQRGSMQLPQTVDQPARCDRLPIIHRATGINNQERTEDVSE